MSAKLFMGLDLSLTGTGCVVLDADGNVLISDCWGDKLKRDARVRDKIERMIYIAKEIIHTAREVLKNDVRIDDRVEFVGDLLRGGVLCVGIEGYAFSRQGAQNDLGELQGVVKSQLWLALGVEPVVMAVSSARKLVVGSGNAKKDRVQAVLAERGFVFDNHNIADAYVIAEAIRRKEQGDDPGA